MYRVILKHATAVALTFCTLTPAHAVEVYLFRGAGDLSMVRENLHFSGGLTKIADSLKADGIHAEVHRFSQVEDALATIRKRKPTSVALIGHSMGALMSMVLAHNLKDEGIRVAYLGLIDIPGPVGIAGENVEWAENFYSFNPVYGKLTNADTHPNAWNFQVTGYIHNRMDDAPEVQHAMLRAVRLIDAEEKATATQVIHAGAGYQPPLPGGVGSTELSHTGTGTVIAEVEKYLDSAPTSTLAESPVSSELLGYETQPGELTVHPVANFPEEADEYHKAYFQAPEQDIDYTITHSVGKSNAEETNSSLFTRVGAYLRQLKERRESRAEAYARGPN